MKHTIKRKPRLATIKAVPKQWVFDGERLSGFEPESIEERVSKELEKAKARLS